MSGTRMNVTYAGEGRIGDRVWVINRLEGNEWVA
jgi:hypothetical protein